MQKMFKDEDLPRNVMYGDETAIEESDLDNIRDAFHQETVTFEWHAGDILILDNMLISHGRTPFKGKRTVLASMFGPYSAVPRRIVP